MSRTTRSGGTHRPRRHRSGPLAVALAVVLSAAAALGGSPPASAAVSPVAAPPPAAPPDTPPDTPAGAQLAWVLDATTRLPLGDAEVAAHVAPEAAGSLTAAAFNEVLTQVVATGPVTLVAVRAGLPGTVHAELAAGPVTWQARLTVDASGLIAGIGVRPSAATPTSWAALDASLAAVADRVRLLVARVDGRGRCRAVHALGADEAVPVASGFKLWVLGALADEVARGRLSWDQPVLIEDRLKSLPSGDLRLLPEGTPVPVRDMATEMIRVSDNTAADHLLALVGRRRVERAQARLGVTDPGRNVPLLSTRELFTLKLTDWPAWAQRWESAPTAERRRLLDHVLPTLPLPGEDAGAGWTAARAIDTIEWFASPADQCRVMVSLAGRAARPGGDAVATALSRNDGGLSVDRSRWPTVWFKGGSEVGVLHSTHRVADGRGGQIVVSMSLTDPERSLLDPMTIETAVAAARGAIELTDRSPC